MGYSLGIDIGAAACAAAVRRGPDLEPCGLGDATATMPAVVLLRADGSALVGERADERCRLEPQVVARTVTRGLARAEPVEIDGHPCHPLPLTEALVQAVLDRARPPGEDAPEHLVVAFPLREDRGPERLLAEAVQAATGRDAVLVPAPVAATAKLAHDRALGPGTLVAVLDFGGATVDVALVRWSPDVVDLVGDPATLTDVGGVDLDGVVLTLVERAIGDLTSTVGAGDHAGMLALRRLRASCRAAKERLAQAPTAIVEVAMPHARAQVEVTREAFEQATEPLLAAAGDLLLAAVEGVGLLPADLDLVLLTGGSARTPALAGLVAGRTGVEVVVDDAPELTVALGAALFGDVADRMPGTAGAPLPAPARRARAHEAPAGEAPAADEAPADEPTDDEPPPADDEPPATGPSAEGEPPATGPSAEGEPPATGPSAEGEPRPGEASVPPLPVPVPVPAVSAGGLSPAFEPWPPAPPERGAGARGDDEPVPAEPPPPPPARGRAPARVAGNGAPALDLRLVVGAGVAAAFLAILVGFAVLTRPGGGVDPITLADTATPTATTEPVPPTTAAPATSATSTGTPTTGPTTARAHAHPTDPPPPPAEPPPPALPPPAPAPDPAPAPEPTAPATTASTTTTTTTMTTTPPTTTDTPTPTSDPPPDPGAGPG